MRLEWIEKMNWIKRKGIKESNSIGQINPEWEHLGCCSLNCQKIEDVASFGRPRLMWLDTPGSSSPGNLR